MAGRSWLGGLESGLPEPRSDPEPSSDPREDAVGPDEVRGADPDEDSLGSLVSSSIFADTLFSAPFSAVGAAEILRCNRRWISQS